MALIFYLAIITRPCLYGCNGFTCETCRPGYVPPRCCECDEGYYYINNYDYYGNFYGFYDYYGRCEREYDYRIVQMLLMTFTYFKI